MNLTILSINFRFLRNFATEKSSDSNKSGRASNLDGPTVNVPSKDIVTPFPPLTEPLKGIKIENATFFLLICPNYTL